MKVLKWIEKNFELVLLMIMLAGFSVVMMAQVIMRYVFNSPFSWAEELCRYFFVATVAFASAYCVRHDVLLRVDVIVELFPRSIQHLFKYFMWVAMIATYMVLAIGGTTVLASAYKTKQVSPAMQMPMWWLYMLVDIGFFLTVARSLQALITEVIQNVRTKNAKKEGKA